MSSVGSDTSRLAQLADTLRSQSVDAFFCTSAVTMGYLAGLHEEGGERLLTLAINKDGRTRLICPELARTQAERSGITEIDTWRDGEDPLNLVRRLAADWGFGSAAVDDEMRAAILLQFQKTLPGVAFLAGQPVLSHLMTRKDENEIRALLKAGDIADKAFESVKTKLRPGMSEWQVHEELTAAMQALGGRPNFCIVATGAHGAEPHHFTGSTTLQEGDIVLMDFGCIYEDYMSDITRVVCLGAPTEEQRRVYEVVYQAHMAGRDAIRPGVSAEEVDRATRKVIDEAGYGEFFVHRTGHGLGRRIHEEPYICQGNTTPLEVGNVFSVEPGIYLPGRLGVRIENIVHVTADGHASLNAEPSPTLENVLS